MTKQVWQIRHAGNDITSKVLSVSTTFGRQKYLDPYSGGSITVTINNASNYASGITYGTTIDLISLYPPNSGFYGTYWVQEVTFSDYPGNTGLNTATITAVDWMSRAGRVQAVNYALPQGGTLYQARLFEATALGPLPADMYLYSYGLGDSIASAITYTGTVNNYINLLQTTERGYITQRSQVLYFLPRSQVGSAGMKTTVTLGRTTSTTQIAYQDFHRIQNGTQFINKATISSTGVADQTSTNTTSVSTYGTAFYSSQTVDYNTTQALGNADWITNNFSDPASLRFECSFTDVAQDATALDSWMQQMWGTTRRVIGTSYTVPGGSPTSIDLVVEGATINITPESTQFTLYMSPLQYYQFFTLDSATLGILDTSRLGW